MSQGNVDMVRSAFEALGRGDFESFLAVLDDDAEWVNPPYAIEPGTRKGAAQFRTALGQLRSSFGDVRPEVHDLIDAGDDVVVVGTWTGEGSGSGVSLQVDFASVLTIRDGKLTRYQWFRERSEALDAAGVGPTL